MILNIDYEDFLKQYVIEPYMDFCISFKFKNRIYQFDFNGYYEPTDIPGKTPYNVVSWKGDWEEKISIDSYKNLIDAIQNARFDGLSFEEVYKSEESSLIDIS